MKIAVRTTVSRRAISPPSTSRWDVAFWIITRLQYANSCGVWPAIFPQPQVAVDGPPCVDLAVRTKDDQILIHLLNTAGMQVTSAYTIRDFIPAVGPLTVRVRMESKPTSVTLVPADVDIEWTWAEDTLSITLPALHIHNVIG